jgi:D-alanyl-D-alanine carboxypeptidase
MPRLLVCLASALWILSAAPLTAQTDAAGITAVIQTKAPEFSGAILVVREGRIILNDAFGLASRQLDVRNTPSNRFRIASITKLFTAVIVLQLVEEGKLDLQKSINTYLPVCDSEIGRTATLHQLLHHTSGLGDVAAVKSKEDAILNGMDVYQKPYSSDALAGKYCKAAPAHPAGTTFFYNNGDYILLGKIIEQSEHEPFETVLNRRILRPLGLRDTGMLYQHEVVPGLASAYFTRTESVRVLSNDLPVYDENWYAAGAMYSTTADLRSFSAALFGGRLLKTESLAALMRPGLDEYGYGTWIYRDEIGGRKYTTVMRPGQIMGTNCVLYHVVEPSLTIIALSNTDRSNVDALALAITKAVLGAK